MSREERKRLQKLTDNELEALLFERREWVVTAALSLDQAQNELLSARLDHEGSVVSLREAMEELERRTVAPMTVAQAAGIRIGCRVCGSSYLPSEGHNCPGSPGEGTGS